jgi:hypothetical protein
MNEILNEMYKAQKEYKIKRACHVNVGYFVSQCRKKGIDVSIQTGVIDFYSKEHGYSTYTEHVWCVVGGKIIEPSYEYAVRRTGRKRYSTFKEAKERNVLSKTENERDVLKKMLQLKGHADEYVNILEDEGDYDLQLFKQYAKENGTEVVFL